MLLLGDYRRRQIDLSVITLTSSAIGAQGSCMPLDQGHLATWKWPEDGPNGLLDNEADVKCEDAEGKDVTDLHREHRRMIANCKSVAEQFKALELNDSDM